MQSNYKLLMFALSILILFQMLFGYYYLLGDGAVTSSPYLGVVSLILGVILMMIMASIYRYHQKNK